MFNKEKNPIAAPIVEQQKTTNKLLSAIAAGAGVGSAISTSGGGLGSILGSIFGGGTPPFNPTNFSSSTNFGSNSSVPFGSRPEEIARQLRMRQSQGGTQGGGFLSSIFGSQGFGNNVGTYGAIGAGAGILGNIVGGTAGGFISNIGSGIATGAALGSIIPIAGTAIGAIIGGGIGLIKSLFRMGANKKKDKKENLPALQQAFSDAFREYGQLITDVRALRVEPNGALARGDELRSQIASCLNISMLSKYGKRESANLIKAELVEIDKRPSGLREQLETAVEMAKAANERAGRILPEFAVGGFLSNGFMSQYGEFKRDYGLLKGGIPGKDTIPVLAQQDEMFLTRKHQAEIIRGAGYDVFSAHTNIPNYPKPQKMETGGYLGMSPVVSTVQNNLVLKLHNVTLAPDAKAFIRSDEGKREIAIAVKDAGKNGVITQNNFRRS